MRRRLITTERIVTTGLANFLRNAWLAVAAIAMMLVTLTIVLFLVISNATFTHTISQITDKIDVSVYLKDTVKPAERDTIINNIKKLNNVKTVQYISKEDALKSYQQQNKNNPDLLAAISQTENPLPATIQIKPKDVNRINEMKD